MPLPRFTFSVPPPPGVFAVHGMAGAVGTILIPLFGVTADGGYTFLGVDQLAMQAAGIVVAVWTVVTATVAFTVADRIDERVSRRVDERTSRHGDERDSHRVDEHVPK